MIEEGENGENQRKIVYFVPEEERESGAQQASISLPSDIWQADIFSYLSTEDASQLWRVSTLFSSLLEYGITTVDFLPNLRRGSVLPWATIQNIRLDIKACRVLDLRRFFTCLEHPEKLESIVLTHGELDIWAHERLNSRDARAVVAIFDNKKAMLPSLRTLDISNNPVKSGIVPFVGYFGVCAPQLENLVLADCRIGSRAATLLAETLSAASLSFSFLTCLNLNENSLGAGVVPLFLAFSGSYHSLREIHLQTTKIKPRHVISLMRELTLEDTFFPALTYLDVSDNSLGDSTASLASFFARRAPYLEELNLDGVDLTEEDLNALIEEFFIQYMQFPSLRHLSLGNNPLRASSITFVHSLPHIAPRLERLNLYRTCIRTEHIVDLIERRDLLSSLEVLDLSENPLKAAVVGLESFFSSTGRMVNLQGVWDIKD